MSPSFITDMLSCSMKAVLKGILKLDSPNKNRSPALLHGSIMHKALEYYFIKIQAREITDSRTMLSLSIEQALKHYEAQAKYYDEKTLQSALAFFKSNTRLIDSLAEFLDMNFLQKAITADKYVKTEFAFNKMPVAGFNFDGRIDLVFDDIIIDFKTTSKNMANNKDEAKRQMAILKIKRECALQLIIYKHAVEQLQSISDSAVEGMPVINKYGIVEIIFTKDVPINYYEFTAKEVEDVAEELRERVAIVIDTLKQKRIYRNFRDTMCPCEYANYCMDESSLDMVLSKLNLPQDFF